MAQPLQFHDGQTVTNVIDAIVTMPYEFPKKGQYISFMQSRGLNTVGDIRSRFRAGGAAFMTDMNTGIPLAHVGKMQQLLDLQEPPPPPPPPPQPEVKWTPPPVDPGPGGNFQPGGNPYPNQPYIPHNSPYYGGGFPAAPAAQPFPGPFGHPQPVAGGASWHGPMINPVVQPPAWVAQPAPVHGGFAAPGPVNGWNNPAHVNAPKPNFPYFPAHAYAHANAHPHAHAPVPPAAPAIRCSMCQAQPVHQPGALCQGCYQQTVCTGCGTYRRSPAGGTLCDMCISTSTVHMPTAPSPANVPPVAQQPIQQPQPPAKCTGCNEKPPKSATDPLCQTCTLRAEGKTPCQDCQIEPAHTETKSSFCVKCKCKDCQQIPPDGPDGRCKVCDLRKQGKRVCTTCKAAEADANYGECSDCRNRPIGGLGALGLGASSA